MPRPRRSAPRRPLWALRTMPSTRLPGNFEIGCHEFPRPSAAGRGQAQVINWPGPYGIKCLTPVEFLWTCARPRTWTTRSWLRIWPPNLKVKSVVHSARICPGHGRGATHSQGGPEKPIGKTRAPGIPHHQRLAFLGDLPTVKIGPGDHPSEPPTRTNTSPVLSWMRVWTVI